MGITINEIASIIDSNVRTGLKGVSNFSYTIPMLEREVTLERNRILDTQFRKVGFRNDEYQQSINCIPVDRKGLSRCPVSTITNEKASLHFVIPPTISYLDDIGIEYIGPTSRAKMSWKVYYDQKFLLHSYKFMTSKLPYVYIDPTSNGQGWMDGWVYNYIGNLKYLSFSGVLGDPEDSSEFQCHGPLEKYPAPEFVVEEIIRRVTMKYMTHYRQAHSIDQPNTQTDKSS
jgi:hypothetical protein